MTFALNQPKPAAAQIPIRVTRLFATTVKLDGLLRRVGLRLPLVVLAWATGRSIQAFIDGQWVNVPVTAKEVLDHATSR